MMEKYLDELLVYICCNHVNLLIYALC